MKTKFHKKINDFRRELELKEYSFLILIILSPFIIILIGIFFISLCIITFFSWLFNDLSLKETYYFYWNEDIEK